MSFNFFQWLRANIKNSVLMGVHDAVDCLGETHDKGEIQKQLVSFLDRNENEGAIAAPTKSGSRKKKLGRTLKQIQAQSSTT